MTAKESAEAYVREKLPELIKNAHAQLQTWDGKTEYFTEYRPIQLQHWLRVLMSEKKLKSYSEEVIIKPNGALRYHFVDDIKMEAGGGKIQFDLITGQPATEADYKAFNEIVGI